MANQLYPLGRQAFLEGSIAWLTDAIRVTLIDLADYTPNFVTDQFYSIIPVAARVAESGNFTGKTSTNGTADADDVTLVAVAGDQSEALVIWKDTTVEATSPLIAFIDTATGLPITPNGSDIDIIWSNGADRIFTL